MAAKLIHCMCARHSTEQHP